MITNEQLQTMKGKIQKALAELSAVCRGKRFTMSIPVQHETDTDCVISDGLAAGAKALAEVEELRAEKEQLEADVNKWKSAYHSEGIRTDDLENELQRMREECLGWRARAERLESQNPEDQA